MSNYLRAEDTVGAPDIVGILEMVAVVNKDDRRRCLDKNYEQRNRKIPLMPKNDTYACY